VAVGEGAVMVGYSSTVFVTSTTNLLEDARLAFSHMTGSEHSEESGESEPGSPQNPDPDPNAIADHNLNIKRYEPAPYHGKVKAGRKNPGPVNGQAALDVSIQIKETSARRVGVDYDAGDIVIFDETGVKANAGETIFHGHIQSWKELHQDAKNALMRSGIVDKKGKIIKR
jgi:hypothetical protein